MSAPTRNAQDLQRIERALDGLLAPAELEALKADIVRDPALRAAYVERAGLDAALRADRDFLPQLLAAPDAAPSDSARSRWPWVALVASAIAACLAVVVVSDREPPPQPVAAVPPRVFATLVAAQDTKWKGSTLPTAEGSALGSGVLALAEGIASVTFASGATLTLEAPTTIEIVDRLHARLIEGSVTAEVPSSAHGFVVETADLRVVDLGTRFGVTASSTGMTHVLVFEGEVKLVHPEGRELRRLTAGKSFHFSSGAVTSGNLEPARPASLDRIDGWTMIPTSFGRGKDAFVRRAAAISEPQPLLMVKHSDLPLSFRNERMACFTFDLANTRASALGEAELLLDPEPSGYGFSALVPDSRFALYGVLDETHDGWNEYGLTWDNFPAVDASAVQAGRARKLAEFSLPRGSSGEPLTVRSPELAAFLRADTNGLATFVLVRETSETDPSGLVHAFASKEHPTARPPTLRVR
jgi:ferric-dicitrate binding protein FerR (iron transport regulator)